MQTIEDVKMWLSRFLENEEVLDRLQERIEGLRTQLESPGSQVLTGMPHSGGYEGDRIGRTLAKIESLEAQGKELLATSRLLYNEINTAISQVRGTAKNWPHRKVVLEMRYLDRFEWSEIIEVLWSKKPDYDDQYDSYSRRTFRIHSEALEAMINIVPAFQGTGNNTENGDTGK